MEGLLHLTIAVYIYIYTSQEATGRLLFHDGFVVLDVHPVCGAISTIYIFLVVLDFDMWVS